MHWTGAKRISLHTFRRQGDSSQSGKSPATVGCGAKTVDGVWAARQFPTVATNCWLICGTTDVGVTKSDVGEVQRAVLFPKLFELFLATERKTLIRSVVFGRAALGVQVGWSWPKLNLFPSSFFCQFCGVTHDILATSRLTADWKRNAVAGKVDLWPLPTSVGSVSRRLSACHCELSSNYTKIMTRNIGDTFRKYPLISNLNPQIHSTFKEIKSFKAYKLHKTQSILSRNSMALANKMVLQHSVIKTHQLIRLIHFNKMGWP